MSIMSKLKLTVQSVASEGTARIDAVKTGRERSKLISELGELTYRGHQGDGVDQSAVDAVLSGLDALEPTDPELVDNDASEEPAS